MNSRRSTMQAMLVILGFQIVMLSPGTPASAQTKPADSKTLSASGSPLRAVVPATEAIGLRELEKTAQEHEQAGRFPEAQETVRTILAIRVGTQGKTHWTAKAAELRLRMLDYLSTRTPQEQQTYRDALESRAQAMRLFGQSRYAEAEPILRRSLDATIKILGEENVYTADTSKELARCLGLLNKMGEAESLARKAMTVYQKSRADDHPAAAEICAVLGILLQKQDKYAEAEEMLRKGLAISQQSLGADDPVIADRSNNLGILLTSREKYADAEQLHRKALAISQKSGGEGNQATLRSSIHLATVLRLQGKYPEAEETLRQTVAICERTPSTAPIVTMAAYLNLGNVLQDNGRYEEAEKAIRKALPICEQTVGRGSPSTAQILMSLAAVMVSQGKYEEGEGLARKGLAIYQKSLGESHTSTALAYEGLATTLVYQSKLGEAEVLTRRALAIHERARRGENLGVERCYITLAPIVAGQGKDTEAEALCRKALAIAQQLHGEHYSMTAVAYSALADALYSQGRYREAEDGRRRALTIWQDIMDKGHPGTAVLSSSLAGVLAAQGKFEDAETMYREALEASRKSLGEEHPETARTSMNLGLVLGYEGKFGDAEALHRKALANYIKTLGGANLRTSECRIALAQDLDLQGKSAEGEQQLRDAARDFELARRLISPSGLSRVGVDVRLSPILLALSVARRGEATEAWKWLEMSLAHGLLDDIVQPRDRGDLERRRNLIAQLNRLDEQIALIAFSGSGEAVVRKRMESIQEERNAREEEYRKFEEGITAKYGAAAVRPYDLLHIQSQLPADAALIAWVDVPTEDTALAYRGDRREMHWACVVRHRGDPAWIKLGGSLGGAWSARDYRLLSEVRRSLTDEASPNWKERAAELAAQRVTPLDPHLAVRGDLQAVKHLIVLNSPSMAGIPVEALLEARPAEFPRYTVSYAPSATVLTSLLQRRKGPPSAPIRAGSPTLLAVGDPILSSRGGDRRPSSAGPSRLPGTRREVEAIAALFDRPTTLLGDQASEQRLDEMAARDLLKGFHLLHIAAHGKMDGRFPMHSALELTPDDRSDAMERVLARKAIYDGAVTAEQILRTWKLDADLVTLSACESGLGRLYGGEGYMGFPQALFLAGARSLVLSLWKVDDQATALLMQRFYQNLLGRRDGLAAPMGKAEALDEAKRWLRDLRANQLPDAVAGLSRGERRMLPPSEKAARSYEHPYYWAGFILIGDPG